MSSTRGVRWLMWVDGTPPMSAATAEIRSSVKYQSWSTGSVDSSNAAVARARKRSASAASSPPWSADRSASSSSSGPNKVRVPTNSSSRACVSASKKRRSVATSIEVNTRNGFFASSSETTGRKAVETTGTELCDASRRS